MTDDPDPILDAVEALRAKGIAVQPEGEELEDFDGLDSPSVAIGVFIGALLMHLIYTAALKWRAQQTNRRL